MNSLSRIIYLPAFLSSCFLPPQQANGAVATMYDSFHLAVTTENDAYI
jgi:hypothetical protein